MTSRRFRAVWTGLVVGAVLVTTAAALYCAFAITPTWHHLDNPFPGAGLRWYVLGAAAAGTVPAGIHLLARARPSRGLDRLDIAATVAGIGAIVTVLVVSGDQRDAASSVQSAPGVLHATAVLIFVSVVGLIIGAVNLLARNATIEHRSRHRLLRRFAAGLIASSTVLAAVAVVVAWPTGVRPTVSEAAARGAWESYGYSHRLQRIDWHGDAADVELAPIAGGFVVAGGHAVEAFVNGERAWTIDFHRPVQGVWGPRVDDANLGSPVLVQVRDVGSDILLTYGVDGTSGAIVWTRDDVGDVRSARMDSLGATLLTRDGVVAVDMENGTQVERVRFGAPAPGCTRGASFAFVRGELTVPLTCAGRPDAIDAFGYVTGRHLRTYVGADFGLPGAGVRVTASDTQVAALEVTASGVRRTEFVTAAAVPTPTGLGDGWTVTSLVRRGGDWTMTGVDPAGRAAVVYATPSQDKTVPVVTGAVGDRLADQWARFGGSMMTVARYRAAQPVRAAVVGSQTEPLTFVGAAIPGSGTDRSVPPITVMRSPCRQVAAPDPAAPNLVVEVGGGVALHCVGPYPESNELFLLR